MIDNTYPHKDALDNLKSISPLISLIDESKEIFVKDNLSLKLHIRQIKLLKQAYSHSLPAHKKSRIEQYKNLLKTPELNELFDFHKNSYIQRYKKLENKGLVEVKLECEELPFDVILTQDGMKLIEEIKNLENKWNDLMLEQVNDSEKLLELLKEVAHKAAPINHNHKKQLKFIL